MAKQRKKNHPIPPVAPYRFLGSLGLLALVGLSLLVVRILTSDSLRFSFLLWNLVLAFIPALLAWWLVTRVRLYGWLKWQQIVLTALWILFLPNSFYIITDLIHLRSNYEADLLFDITLLMSFIVTGLMLGFISVYLVHTQMLRRMRERSAYGLIAILLLAASFAICLGRYTRWNTWDILLQPIGLLFDVSDRVINPDAHLQTYQTTVVLFLLLLASYSVVYEAARLIKRT
ncbi:MAG: DUF1361 domain-containing protein [Candidatus Saccharimonadales bacterium]